MKDAEEITTKFLWEQGTFTSVYSYYGRKPGNENIVAFEDTTTGKPSLQPKANALQ